MKQSILCTALMSASIIMLVSISSHAADRKDLFAVKGVGTMTCQHYMQAGKEKASSFLMFAGYINGYVTAYNRLSPQTFDIAPWQNTDTLTVLLGRFCRKNVKTNFVLALGQLIKLLEADRLKLVSKMIKINVGKQQIGVYKEVIVRLQQKLKRLKYYSGKATGQYDKKTHRALSKFQQKTGLKQTGVPDQLTLAKLFFSK